MIKKIYHLTVYLLFMGTISFAQQWNGSSSTTGDIYRTGNVAIGTTTPQAPLHVLTSAIEMAAFKNTTGINTRIIVANTTGQVNLGIGEATPHPYLWSNTNSFFIGSDGAPTLFVNGMSGGNVGIGTTTTGSFRLAVEGKIGAREIQVTNANPWPDYVFNKQYKLRSLASLDDYIQKNNRLPNMPSAEEVKDNGIELGHMNTLVVQHMEELTLHVIALNKNMMALNKKIEKLEKENAILRKQLKK